MITMAIAITVTGDSELRVQLMHGNVLETTPLHAFLRRVLHTILHTIGIACTLLRHLWLHCGQESYMSAASS